MSLWRIDLFENPGYAVPVRSGYCRANTEGEATAKAKAALEKEGGAKSADAIRVTTRSIPLIPTDNVVWED